MKRHAAFFVISSVLALGCASEDTATVALELRATTGADTIDPGSLTMADNGDVEYALQAASLHLRNIEIDLPDGLECGDIAEALSGPATCETAEAANDEDKIVIDGPFDVDLVGGKAEPSIESVRIPVGDYKRIDFRVEDNADDVSFAVRAAFRHEDQDLTLDLSLDFNEDIRIEAEQGVSVTEETDLIAEFVIDSWLAGVDIGSCIADGDVVMDGTTVVVDESSTSGSCSDIEDTIKNNMKNSGQLDRRD